MANGLLLLSDLSWTIWWWSSLFLLVGAFGANIIACFWAMRNYKRKERLSENLLSRVIAIACSTGLFFGFALESLEYIRAHWSNVSVVYEGPRLLQHFIEGTLGFCALWTVFAIWLTIYEGQMRQGSAVNYDQMLMYITDILKNAVAKARQAVGDHPSYPQILERQLRSLSFTSFYSRPQMATSRQRGSTLTVIIGRP